MFACQLQVSEKAALNFLKTVKNAITTTRKSFYKIWAESMCFRNANLKIKNLLVSEASKDKATHFSNMIKSKEVHDIFVSCFKDHAGHEETFFSLY